MRCYESGALSNIVMSATISRHHDDYGGVSAGTGALDSNADGNAFKYTAANLAGRAQITATWYDGLDRPTDTVAYGTYGGSDFDRKPSGSWLALPSRSDTALVTTRAYDGAGQAYQTTDPRGLVTRLAFDDLGRKTAEIRNYVNGTPSGPTGDDDVHTRWVYTTGMMTKMWVDLDGDDAEDADDQVTSYTYGVTKGVSAGDSKIASNRLLLKEVYPPQYTSPSVQVEADRRVSHAYNALGQSVWRKDQDGNIIETDYDLMGRPTHRRVTTLASGFDNAVLRVSTVYESRGLVSTVTQYDNATVGSGSVVDQVKYTLDGWGLATNIEQDRNSTVGLVGSVDDYEVAFLYVKSGDAGGRNTLVRTEQKLRHHATDRQVVTYDYLSSTSAASEFDELSGRVSRVRVGASPVTVAEYEYNGLGALVRTDLPQPDVFYSLDGATPRSYDRLDRFGRVTISRWTKDLATDRDFYSTDIAYDRNSNVASTVDALHKTVAGGTPRAFDALYGLDGLDRVTRVQEGNLSGGSITTLARDERWLDGSGNLALTQTGNWERCRLDLNGDGDFTDSGECDETRAHDLANGLSTRDTDSNASVNFTLAANKRGDTTDDGEGYTYEYDAFGRLRKLRNRSNAALVAEYTYNGLGHRVGWHYDADADADTDGSDPWYYFAYDDKWRVVATFRGTDTAPKETFVYHAAGLSGSGTSSYIDSVVLRDKDANTAWTSASDATLEQRRYHCQNWRADVVALITEGAIQTEQARYAAYGTPFNLPAGDTDADGDCDVTDSNKISAWWGAGAGAYDVRGDLDLDGDVDSSDVSRSATVQATGGRGVLSKTTVGSRKGYAGYEHDGAIAKLWHVRRRVLDSGLGRWTRRDPWEQQTGVNILEYCDSQPMTNQDPSGLFSICVCAMCLSCSATLQGGWRNYSTSGNCAGSSREELLELLVASLDYHLALVCSFGSFNISCRMCPNTRCFHNGIGLLTDPQLIPFDLSVTTPDFIGGSCTVSATGQFLVQCTVLRGRCKAAVNKVPEGAFAPGIGSGAELSNSLRWVNLPCVGCR